MFVMTGKFETTKKLSDNSLSQLLSEFSGHTFLGTMLELSTNTFTLLKNPCHKNSTIILCSALCNMVQNLELAGAIQEVQWFKMMV
jgi:hypothetical protein